MKLRDRLASAVSEIAPEVMAIFLAYDWPGNVRELENVMERALALCPGTTILPDHLPEGLHQAQARPLSKRAERDLKDDLLHRAVQEVEKEQLLEALRRTGGNRTEAAALLNIHRATLYFRLKKYGIDFAEVGIRRKTNPKLRRC